MKVFEFQCKIKFLKDIEYQNVYEKTTYLLDGVLVKDEQYLKFHESKDYKFYVNKEGFYRMRLSFETDQTGVLEYENERGNHQIPFGMGNHQIGMFPEYDQLCASSGAWCSKDTFHVCCQMIDESVAAVHFKLVFAENGTMTILMKKTEETKFNEFQGVYTAVG